MIYNIHYDICAVFIELYIICVIIIKKGLRLKQNRVLMTLAIFCLSASFFDIMTAVANSYVDQWSYGIRDFLNYMYLISHNGMTCLFLFYVASVCGLFFANSHKRLSVLLMLSFYIIDLFILFLNPFLHWAFYYDENKMYRHGMIFIVLYINAFLYLIFALRILHKYSKKIAKGKRLMCYIFVFSSLIIVAIQMMIPSTLISLCVNSLSLLGVLLVIDNEDEIIDPISKCFNRRFFVQTNMERMGQDISYQILSIKLLDYNLHTATLGIQLINKFIAQVGAYLERLSEEAEVFYYEKGAFAIIYASDLLGIRLENEIQQRFSENWCVNDVTLQLGIDLQMLKAGKQFTSVEELLLSLESKNDENIQAEDIKTVSVGEYRRQLSVVRAIKRAMVTDSFVVRYQPVWNAKKNMITKAKAVVHIQDDELGILEPEEFMQAAEKNELSNEIGDIILRKVVKTYKERDLDKFGIDIIEVSLSRVQCMNIHLKERVMEILEEFDLDTKHIEFHFSISNLLKQQEMIIKNMTALQNVGFQVYAVGYGSESVRIVDLLQYVMDGAQIDKKVLQKAMEQEQILIFMKNSVRMFHEMKISTEIEGVDDIYSKEMAVDLKCDYLMGQFFSGPVDEEGLYRYSRGFNLR